MAELTRFVRAGIAEVFAAVADPWTYPEWLVGARAIRAVDARWPDVGSHFHHRVGLVGPITVADSTEVIAIDPPHLLELEVRFRPLGRGRVRFDLAEEPTEGNLTRLTMDEVPLGLLATAKPLLEHTVRARNELSLNALVAYLNAPTHKRPT